MSLLQLLVFTFVPILMIYGNKISEEDQIVYIKVGKRRVQIYCNKPEMTISSGTDGEKVCLCPKQFRLKIRSTDLMDAFCVACMVCSNDPSNPFEVMACGMYKDPLCCPNPNMRPLRTENDYFDCQDLEAELAKYTKCDKPNMSPEKRKDGTQICRCAPQHYLNPGSDSALDAAECSECAGCGDTKYKVKSCGRYSNTLCCDKPGMEARLTEYGFDICHEPSEHQNSFPTSEAPPSTTAIPQPISSSNNTNTQTNDTSINEGNTQTNDTSINEGRSLSGLSFKMIVVIVVLVVIVTLLVVILIIYCCWRKIKNTCSTYNIQSCAYSSSLLGDRNSDDEFVKGGMREEIEEKNKLDLEGTILDIEDEHHRR